MQQGVLAVYCFEGKTKASIGQLISERFGRIANGVATAQDAMFTEQHDGVSIVVLQVAFDVASPPAFEMIFEHFNR